MLTTFLSWTTVGLFARAGLAHVLRIRWRRRWGIHPTIAGTAICSGWLLSFIGALPLMPSVIPVPFGIIFGFFILDAVVVRL